MKRGLLFSGVALLILLPAFYGCKKEKDDEWKLCLSCGIDAWPGTYSGSGDYYSQTSNQTVNAPEITVTITKADSASLEVTVYAKNILSETMNGVFPHMPQVQFSNGTYSFNAGIYTGPEGTKLSGTVRKVDTAKVEVLNFEVYK